MSHQYRFVRVINWSIDDEYYESCLLTAILLGRIVEFLEICYKSDKMKSNITKASGVFSRVI